MKIILIKMAQYIRNYLVLNVFVIVPILFLVTWNFPEELEFFIDTPSALSIRIAQGCDNADDNASGLTFSKALGLATDAGGNVAARMFFARPFDVNQCAYKFVGDDVTFEFKKMSISRHLFFRWDLPARDFVASFEMSDNVNVRFSDDGRCFMKINGAEAIFRPKRTPLDWSFPSLTLVKFYGLRRMLLYASQFFLLMFAFFPMCIRQEKWAAKSRVAYSVAVAAAFAVFVCGVLPLQTYLANRDAFDIMPLDMAKSALYYVVALGAASFCCLLVASCCYGRLFHVILSLFLLYEYLQTGILSMGFPSLNGDQQFFTNGALALRDLLVFAGIMCAGLGCYKLIKNYAHWIALGVALLGLASLFDVKGSTDQTRKLPEHAWKNSKFEVVESVCYSPDRNVIVLIPDTLQGDVAQDVIEKCPEIRALFAGFTGFSNNLGMHEFTLLGLPSLMMGRHYEGKQSPTEFLYSIAGKDSFVAAYVNEGLPVYALPHVRDCAYTNRSRGADSGQVEKKTRPCSSFEKRQEGVPYVNIWDVLTFRLSPFFLKRMVMNLNFAGIDGGGDLWFEATLLPFLEVAPVSSEHKTALHVFHTNGLHTPIGYDRTGKRVNVPQDYRSMFEQCYFVLERIGRYMEKLKSLGVFDNSLIVIAADHGGGVSWSSLAGGEEVPGRLRPILWVKPIRNQAPMVFDYVPTSHVKIKDLLVRSKDEDLTIAQIREILLTGNRFFRQHFTGYFKDWHVDGRGKVECRNAECPYKGKGVADEYTR